MTNETKTGIAVFEVGVTYFTRSSCDYECIFRYQVVRRTKKSVWIKDLSCSTSDVVRRSVSVSYDSEMIFPEGRYSMCPVLRAERVAPAQEEES
tara:strand:+ start:1018 stop:1299 length:282 start_codon:yes stop_codon:yes gene_type:complete